MNVNTGVSPGDCQQSFPEGDVVAASPYTRVRYQFGMLLGVDDFETEQSFHRAKRQLHQSWLHGSGVVWGLKVSFNEKMQLQIDPGLALDAHGRELHLDTSVCLDVASWYDQHRDDADLHVVEEEGHKRFDAHVAMRYRACLSRPVPSLADPCGQTQADTAFSRVIEVVETLLLPGRSHPKPGPYHRLRVLFGLEEAGEHYEEVEARRYEILTLALEEQPQAYLKAFREFAALDGSELHPPASPPDPSPLFPVAGTADVVVANVTGILIGKGDKGYHLVHPFPAVHMRGRPTLLPTATVQELLNGPLFRDEGSQEDAGGPRIERDSVTRDERMIAFRVRGALRRSTVTAEAFRVSVLHRDGWIPVEIEGAEYEPEEEAEEEAEYEAEEGGEYEGEEREERGEYEREERGEYEREAGRVRLYLEERPHGELIRIIAHGRGTAPILGADFVPLAGATDGPPGTVHEGNDFVHMIVRS
jgi:hypothetical protein